ncbi:MULTISPECIES: 2-hydroxychromene-2-carboxylate isomerase [unclassified Cupriavidus]|jgi:2-hydroxychromene-2-carboxylate isomerase|uniref:2-hydroxychromene-2-carboxylate isomerase n=1 Tax=unclassified Cupriavidus TaxID=2640874 RepID=UPI001C001F26|nr:MULTISPECIES: 2-hydroxychromene-2-carboxylate isomerase [unclassified Cupriavidus]MCA3182190.1 2-hydroxychromene-2-carboxylate isomerase [Cupriavidus sp.]MCA3189884.1 2-hydroxychromene-2-carboxylate isomerase [Cupriavidus sp.]MCA3196783.1 2-hydroxychromene-2-carboxylate isomerase [Cupriavidus sp.]MCA3204282.1 2-hydroxychromene-2-carboxylate isomerase [Cupriavidus sp.]MCA3209719.1 2-hydroxychromene-2-carboxylate isomerase [Cupriavidus sp.]
MSKQVEYFLAPQSPFVYLGHARFVEIANRHQAQVLLKPADLGKVFSVSGGLPLAQRPPQRQAYRLVELERWSQFLGIPLNLHPTYFPVSGDAAARLIIAAQLAHGTARALALTGGITRAVWAEQRNIADAATLAQIADENDLDGASLLKASEGQAVQAAYAQNTQDAISANVFGAPWFIHDGQSYWGQDRLDFLDRALAAG